MQSLRQRSQKIHFARVSRQRLSEIDIIANIHMPRLPQVLLIMSVFVYKNAQERGFLCIGFPLLAPALL